MFKQFILYMIDEEQQPVEIILMMQLLLNLLQIMKTLGRFVLVDSSNKKQLYLQWKTQTALNRGAFNRTSNQMSYSRRKNLISDLKSENQPTKQTADIKRSTNVQTSASMNQLAPFFYVNPEREPQEFTIPPKTQTKTFYRTRSLGKLSRHTSIDRYQAHQDGISKLKTRIMEADRRSGRVIAVMKMRREGLRYSLKYQYFILHKDTEHKILIKEIKEHLFAEFQNLKMKKPYLFHLSKEPINNCQTDINEKEFVVFADMSPKFNIPFDLQMRMFEQASIIQEHIMKEMSCLAQLNQGEDHTYYQQNLNATTTENKKIYEWQKIGNNIKGYIDKMVDDPSLVKKIRKDPTEKDEVDLWCEEHYKIENESLLKKQQKNHFFDVQNHFPNETTEPRTLSKAAARVNLLPSTQNRHQIKPRPIENMMEKIKRENEEAEVLKKAETERVRSRGYKSQKYFLKQLDQKNPPLVSQNIPYIMSKYGINRSQAYNLYNLYKSLEKASAMRLFEGNQHLRVKQKGIDRKTFDEGLQGLEINPGDELVRNICYFPEFITWEQFIKIISISMRKTPKSKLEAILEGLGSDRGYLTREQIEIMVGSSLQKIFSKDEPQLRKYFVSVVMKELDTDKSGTIQVEELKSHVLTKGIQNLDIVTYLMLNS